ncbi:hypothetical protein Mal64_11810 [Pseudobythopirellula maris]|uniref:Uncharacterized protein n=1 Tax=Pseudobythopirellula maris TaxID=2527991 RepID=A0A5C5ZTB2_9BACT|nr:hypothetical protein [Pseudobythopirellula maris]TWT90784.1 hypothetical protein Mal64_11810 [Pseudobythopirellula maris]
MKRPALIACLALFCLSLALESTADAYQWRQRRWMTRKPIDSSIRTNPRFGKGQAAEPKGSTPRSFSRQTTGPALAPLRVLTQKPIVMEAAPVEAGPVENLPPATAPRRATPATPAAPVDGLPAAWMPTSETQPSAQPHSILAKPIGQGPTTYSGVSVGEQNAARRQTEWNNRAHNGFGPQDFR